MNIANPLPSTVPVFSLANRAGGSAPPVAEPRQAGVGNRVSGSGDESPARADQRIDQKASGEKADAQGLDSAQLKELTELKARDREVRAHESAHQAVGGQYAGAISYVYERGPDGAQYAVGGEVSIDTAPVDGDPQATIEKMRTVRAAALAPAEPSPQDRAVAAQAMQLMLQAQSELSIDSGREDGQAARGEEGSNIRVNRNASDTYQSVFSLGDVNTDKPAPEAFRATA